MIKLYHSCIHFWMVFLFKMSNSCFHLEAPVASQSVNLAQVCPSWLSEGEI